MLNQLTVEQLKAELLKRGLDTTGLKPALVARLSEALSAEKAKIATDSSDNEPSNDEYDNTGNGKSTNTNTSNQVSGASELPRERKLSSRSTNTNINNQTSGINGLSQEQKINMKSQTNFSEFKIRDIGNLVPYFSSNNNIKIRTWLKDFEEIADMLGWNEIEKFVFAKSKLTGTAKIFARTCTFKSYKELKSKLIAEFDKDICKADIYLKLQRRTKKPNESFREYFYRMIEIANTADVDEQSIIHFIINGIRDKDENKQILYNASTLEELKNKLDIYERIKLRLGSTTTEKHEIPYRSNNNLGKIHCFNCGSKYHTRKDCTAETKCFLCNQRGHNSKECPRKSEPSTSKQSNVHIIQMQNTKTIYIRNIPFQTLIDTGSEISLIKKDAYDYLQNIKLTNHKINLIGLGTGKSQSMGCFETTFNIDNIWLTGTFHVVPNESIRVQCIIGNDIISKAKVVIDKNGIIFYKAEEENSIMHIEVDKDVDIDCPPKYEDSIQSLIINYKPQKNIQCPISMSIILRDEKPIYSTPRRLPITEKLIVEKQIKEWLSEGIIRPSKSPFSSNVVVVKKKDGSHRICVDYRRLNAKTVKEHFPVPVVEDVLDKLADAKVFSKLDLKNGFFHIPISETSIKYTAFTTHEGHFEFTRIPFGLTNSPAVFLQFIHMVFRELSKKGIVETYMDDLIVAANSEEANIEKLKIVLKTAAENGLNIKWSKCSFLKRRIEFLGHVVENGTISPSEDKIKAVKNFPEPKKVKDIQAFLGLTGFFRKFIENYSIIARPLTNLLQKNINFKIGKEQREAIDKLKNSLTSKPVLHLFNQNADTEIHTDASKVGCAAVLMQHQADNKYHPVHYYSRKNSPSEENYHSYTLEVMAVYLALKKFRVYVLGTKFKIVTDCIAFRQTIEKKDPPAAVARWIMYMQEFQFDVMHRPGSRMTHVDSLSRNPAIYVVEKELLVRLKKAQDTDQFVIAIKEILKTKPYEDFMIKGDLLFKYKDGKELLVIPRSMENEIIKIKHNEGHFSTKKTIHLINNEFFISKLESKVQNCIANCVKCILANRKVGKQDGFLHPLDKEDRPLQSLHLDHIGPMISTAKQYKYILTVVDGFSKYVWIYPTKTLSAEETLKRLKEQQQHFGNPKRFITDRGPAFIANSFEEFCKEENIEHILITAGVPRGNGQVERINKIIINVLKKLAVDSPEKWYKWVPRVQVAINSTFQRSIQRTPFEVLFGIPMKKKDDIDVTKLIKEAALDSFDEERDYLRYDAKQQIARIQQENRKTFDRTRKVAKEYEVGDLVAIKNTQFRVGNKLSLDFLGPYEVTRKGRHGRYTVTKCFDTEGPKTTTTSSDNMKPWRTGDDLQDEDEGNSFGPNESQDGRM